MVSCLAFLAFACGKPESGSEEGGGPNAGGVGGAADSAQSGSAGNAVGGTSGSSVSVAGMSMLAGGSATLGGASGALGGALGGLGGTSAMGGEPSELEAGSPSAAGAPGGCSGYYHACGCGCCAGSVTPASCVYADLGQDLSAIVAADAATKQGPSCATAGCNFGRDYFCCAAPPATNDGATYQSDLYIGGVDRIRLHKMGAACSTLSLAQVFTANPDPNAFPVQVPAGWKFESVTSLPCTSSAIGPRAIGAIGQLSLRVEGAACLIDAHLTAFFTNDTPEVSSVRFDADGVPLDIPVSECN